MHNINPLNAELNPICHLLALLGGATIVVVSRLRVNTRNKHHLHRPVANRSCFQKGAAYSGIRIFNSLPRIITNLKNEKTQFKVALKNFLNAHSFYSVDEFFTCTDDMYY